jgi:hypothetical protein
MIDQIDKLETEIGASLTAAGLSGYDRVIALAVVCWRESRRCGMTPLEVTGRFALAQIEKHRRAAGFYDKP